MLNCYDCVLFTLATLRHVINGGNFADGESGLWGFAEAYVHFAVPNDKSKLTLLPISNSTTSVTHKLPRKNS